MAAADPVLAELIARLGPCTLAPQEDLFGSLVESIVSQQISVKAADSIFRRLVASLPEGRLDAAALAAQPVEALRGAGLSGAKALSVLDLAALRAAPDDAVIAALIPVRGVGRWTAEMFLIFALGRPDILPVGDLGLRRGVRVFYRLPADPAPAELPPLAASWRPYRSVATWYLWRGLTAGLGSRQ